MAKFISDAEMEALESKQPKKANFISDEEMSKLEQLEQPQEESSGITGRGLLKGTLEALPMAGGLAGGFFGTAAGPVGTVGGAAAGGYLGKAVQNLGEKYLLGEDKTREDIYVGPVKEAALAAAGEGAGQIALKGIGALGTGIKKTASSLSRIPEKTMETYAKKTKDVEKLINQFGDDVAQSSDEFKGLINKQIGSFKSKQNDIIEKSLRDKVNIVDIKPIKEQLSETLTKLDKKLEPESYKKISEKLQMLDELAPDDWTDLTQLNKIKQNLQDASDYDSLGNVLRKKSLAEVNLAKSASKARGILNKEVPEIAKANNSLAKIHRAQKNMNKNLVKEGAPEAGIISAGTGENKRNLGFLSKLQDIVGGDFVSGAENIAAQKQFADPGLLPGINTGAAALPLIGAGLGGLGSGDVEGALKGATIGAIGSPYIIKQAIKYGIPLTEKLSPEILKLLTKGASQAGTRGLLNNE